MRTIIILLAVLATSLAFAADQKVYTEATGPKVQTSVPANSSGADYISPIRARIQDKFHVPAWGGGFLESEFQHYGGDPKN